MTSNPRVGDQGLNEVSRTGAGVLKLPLWSTRFSVNVWQQEGEGAEPPVRLQQGGLCGLSPAGPVQATREILSTGTQGTWQSLIPSPHT